MSVAKENFIKTIYHLEQHDERNTRPGSVARELGISSAAATDMARKLADRDLLHYQKYRQLKLTPKGKQMAMNILRKHRLWEAFLHQVLNLSLHEIHREAELLEHQTSDFLLEKIDNYLGNPEFDPHGDPIPNKDGEIPEPTNEEIISNSTPGLSYVVSRLASSEKEFFEFCKNNRIHVGTRVKVLKQYPKSRMSEILVEETRLLLNLELASIIFVKPASAERN